MFLCGIACWDTCTKKQWKLRNVSFAIERQPLDLVHSDVGCPMPSISIGGAQYFITFIDDATCKVWAYAMKSKDETFACFQRLLSSVETKSGQKLKALRSDNGGEYFAHEFKDFCVARGIKREFTASYILAQNGIAECMNCTIQERVTSMLLQSRLTQGFWVEALYTAVYLINCTPNATLKLQVLEELWSRHKVSYDRLRIFGYEAYVHVPKELRMKLDPKSRKCIFICYGLDGEFGYRLWDS